MRAATWFVIDAASAPLALCAHAPAPAHLTRRILLTRLTAPTTHLARPTPHAAATAGDGHDHDHDALLSAVTVTITITVTATAATAFGPFARRAAAARTLARRAAAAPRIDAKPRRQRRPASGDGAPPRGCGCGGRCHVATAAKNAAAA